ncbi:MAG TPA: LON peptidase substrate-binding domain-containing protein [Steroidobacteraceae bacterium]
MTQQQIALFPLNTVLFPGGLLPLRIFETRYVDMVGRCLRTDSAFGVVLIDGGSDQERDVNTAAIGTSARIVDFQTLEDGLLGLLCRGERRFRIRSRDRLDDGLNCAVVEWLEPEQVVAMAAQYQPLVPLLRQAMASLTTVGRFIEPNYEDASWVSHRLAELLPLDHSLQQQLLEIDDPQARLSLLAPLIDVQT